MGKQIGETYGLTNGVEVTNDVFESEANVAFEQAENRSAHDQGVARRDARRLTDARRRSPRRKCAAQTRRADDVGRAARATSASRRRRSRRSRRTHQLVITHGNGPQVGLLALQGAAYKPDEAYPLDVLGAETEGMIGYMIEQELGNLLPFEVPFATLLTMVEVDADDPGFKNPTKFVGPVYEKPDADRIAKEKGWVFKQDGKKWRRVVASPHAAAHLRDPARSNGCSITARS